LDAEGDDNDGKCWSAAFENRMSYKDTIKVEIGIWVLANLARWQQEKPKWFNIEKIPDYFLPGDVLEAQGGAKRRRNSMSLREMVGLEQKKTERRVRFCSGGNSRIHPTEQ